MKITKNIRISLYILVPILIWMLSGIFKTEKLDEPDLTNDLFTVQTVVSNSVEYQPLIKLKATSMSEARIGVKAKTSGEVVNIGAVQGEYVNFNMCAIENDTHKWQAGSVKGMHGGKLMCETRNERKFNSDTTQVNSETTNSRRYTRSGRGPRGTRMVIPSPDGDGTEWELVRRRTTRPPASKTVSTPSFQA